MAHTPGPLRMVPTPTLGEDGLPLYYEIKLGDGPRSYLSVASLFVAPDHGMNREEVEGNALLFAAAPDQNAALHAAERFMNSLQGRVSLEVWRDMHDPLKAVRDAIAKAEAPPQGPGAVAV